MNEETTQKEEEPTTTDTGEGVQSKATSDLDRADEIVERRNRVWEREEAILERKEALAARQAVGGTIDAGQEPKKVEETPEEYAKRVMANSL
jgi:hypothetical protein